MLELQKNLGEPCKESEVLCDHSSGLSHVMTRGNHRLAADRQQVHYTDYFSLLRIRRQFNFIEFE